MNLIVFNPITARSLQVGCNILLIASLLPNRLILQKNFNSLSSWKIPKADTRSWVNIRLFKELLNLYAFAKKKKKKKHIWHYPCFGVLRAKPKKSGVKSMAFKASHSWTYSISSLSSSESLLEKSFTFLAAIICEIGKIPTEKGVCWFCLPPCSCVFFTLIHSQIHFLFWVPALCQEHDKWYKKLSLETDI